MIILKEYNENWFVLESDFYTMAPDMEDLEEVERLLRKKIIQMKNRHYNDGDNV